MLRRGALRLVAVGLVTGLLPACFGTPHRVNRDLVDAGPPADAPAIHAVSSPYAQVRVPQDSRPSPAKLTLTEKTPLPERPKTLTVDAGPSALSLPSVPDDPRPHPPTIQVAVKTNEDGFVVPPTPPDESPLLGMLRCYLNRRPDLAVNLLKGLDPLNQEVLLQMLPLMVHMTDGPLAQADPQQLAVDVEQLQGLLLTLRPRAALVVDKLCFCRQVRKFGVYEALDERPIFHPGELVEVYAEVRNVSCERHASKAGDYRTHLASKVEIRDANGRFGKGGEFDKIDLCHTPQYDYFQHYRFRVPPEPGSYSLHLDIADVATGRKVGRKLEFQIRE